MDETQRCTDWLPVADARYAFRYEVSDRGYVRNRQTARLLKPRPNRGHVKVALYSGGNATRSERFVHRLVLEAFAGPCPDGMEACHGPGGPADNRWPENLRWDTHQANSDDAVRDGDYHQGERHRSAKLTDSKVLEMRRLYAAGNGSTRQLAAMYGVDKATAYRAISGATWTHLTVPARCVSCGHLPDVCPCPHSCTTEGN